MARSAVLLAIAAAAVRSSRAAHIHDNDRFGSSSASSAEVDADGAVVQLVGGAGGAGGAHVAGSAGKGALHLNSFNSKAAPKGKPCHVWGFLYDCELPDWVQLWKGYYYAVMTTEPKIRTFVECTQKSWTIAGWCDDNQIMDFASKPMSGMDGVTKDGLYTRCDETTCIGGGRPYRLPPDWELAPEDPEVAMNVITEPHTTRSCWGTYMVVFKNGNAYKTTDGKFYGGGQLVATSMSDVRVKGDKEGAVLMRVAYSLVHPPTPAPAPRGTPGAGPIYLRPLLVKRNGNWITIPERINVKFAGYEPVNGLYNLNWLRVSDGGYPVYTKILPNSHHCDVMLYVRSVFSWVISCTWGPPNQDWPRFRHTRYFSHQCFIDPMMLPFCSWNSRAGNCSYAFGIDMPCVDKPLKLPKVETNITVGGKLLEMLEITHRRMDDRFSCPTEDMVYPNSWNNYGHFDGTKVTMDECKERCQEDPFCGFVIFRSETGDCTGFRECELVLEIIETKNNGRHTYGGQKSDRIFLKNSDGPKKAAKSVRKPPANHSNTSDFGWEEAEKEIEEDKPRPMFGFM